MKKTTILWAATFWISLGAVCAFGQQRTIQPSPAYQSGGATYYQPVPAVQPMPAAGQPVYYVPQPMPAGAQPVYYVPQPAPQMTLAQPAFIDLEEEEEEGLYWFWGSKWPGLALGAKIGTTGLGLDLVFGVSPYLNLRVGGSYGDLSIEAPIGDVDYDTDITITSVPLLVDVHPFGNHFRLTGGIFFQTGSSADLLATPTEAIQIGSHTYAPDVVGTLTGEIEVSDTVSPYVGLGFGNAVGEDQLLCFMMDLGVVFQSYDVTLTSNGAGMTTKLDTFRVDLAQEEQNIQEDVNKLKVYPVFTMGIAYHF